MAGEAREECAVAAVVGTNPEFPASQYLQRALFSMQHRGPEASGIACQVEDGTQTAHHGPGLVRDVYRPEDLESLVGPMGVGHNRYSTNGGKEAHIQPFIDPHIDFAFAQNGNLPVTDRMDDFLGYNHIRTNKYNDGERMGLTVASFIRQGGHDLPAAVDMAHHYFRGAYSCVAMHDGLVVAFRDPKGIRPLALGELPIGGIAVASETCGLDRMGARYVKEVAPGEMAIITPDGKVEYKQLTEGVEKLDIFEFIYFARPDSYLYGQRVHMVRRRLGEQLAAAHPPITDDTENTMVIPVPETSVPVAEGYAKALGLEHSQGIIKDRYVGRTFLMPDDALRQIELDIKHNMISELVQGKHVILVDDSLVRGNTIPRLVARAWSLGAKSVTVLIASPPVRYPDFYGIDTPDQAELPLAWITPEEMRQKVLCNYLGFLTLSATVAATKRPPEDFNLSCFNGDYPVGIGPLKHTIITPGNKEYIDL